MCKRGNANLVALDLCNLLLYLVLRRNAPSILGLAALGDGHSRGEPRADRGSSHELRDCREG